MWVASTDVIGAGGVLQYMLHTIRLTAGQRICALTHAGQRLAGEAF